MNEKDDSAELVFARNKQIIELCRKLSAFAERHGIGRISVICAGDDFAQECILEFVGGRSLDSADWPREPLAWVIARRRLIDHRRKRNEYKLREATDFSVLVSGEMDEQVTPMPVERSACLPSLQETAIDILRLKHIAKYTDAEIARTMKMTVDGIRSSLKRSHRRFRCEHGGATNELSVQKGTQHES